MTDTRTEHLEDPGQEELCKNKMLARNIIPATKKNMTEHTNQFLKDIAMNNFKDKNVKKKQLEKVW